MIRVTYNILAYKPQEILYLAERVLGSQGGAFPRLPFFAWTLDTQTQDFSTRVSFGSDPRLVDPDALYVVFSGSNDLVDIIFMTAVGILNESDISGLFSRILYGIGTPGSGGINGAIQAMVTAGAQDILVPNMPNLGVVPEFPAYGLEGLAQSLTEQYNAALNGLLVSWEGSVNIIPFNTFALTAAVAGDPEAFGFTNATEPCYTGWVAPVEGEWVSECMNPEQYVFWDKEHPTTAFHALMAQRMEINARLGALVRQVDELDAKNGVKSPLLDKSQGALDVLVDGNLNNDQAAIGKLGDFIAIVQAKAGKTIAPDAAESLITEAQDIIELLEEAL